MKILLFSDLHLYDKSADIVFKEVFPGLEKALYSNNIKTLVCLGDFYHIRYKIDALLQNNTFNWFKKLVNNGVVVYLLTGNHDQINDNGDNSLEVYNEIKGVSVISKPMVNELGVWFPYRKDLACYENYNISGRAVCFAHIGIKGFLMQNFIFDTNGLSPEFFKNLIVLCGHYHKRQSIGNIHYIGSTHQIDAGESLANTGYTIFDYETGKLDFINSGWGRHFYKMCNIPEGASITGVRSGDVIKITPPDSVTDLISYKKSLNIPEGVECIIDLYRNNNAQRLLTNDNSFESYVKAYVKQFKDNLDEKLLFEIFEDIKKETGLC